MSSEVENQSSVPRDVCRSPLETMNAEKPSRRHPLLRFAVCVAIVLAVTLVASLGYAAWEYTAWRNKMIEWDYGTIDRLCGGDTDQDRLSEIRFVKQWEYKALKRTPEGNEVWLHWKLSKRHCGNWMVIDKSDGFVIRPFEVRFPNGAAPRDAVSCLGIPIDENEKYKRRDEMLTRLAAQRGEPSHATEPAVGSVLKSTRIAPAR